MSLVRARTGRDRILSWVLNLSGLCILVLLLVLGGAEAWRQIAQADWRYILGALGVTLLWNALAAYRWSLLPDALIAEPGGCPVRYYLAFHMIGMLAGQVLPVSIGMLGARPVALSAARGVPLGRAGLSVLLDKGFDALLALLLVGPVASYLAGWTGLSLALALKACCAAAALVAIAWGYARGVSWLLVRASRLARPFAHLPLLGQGLVRRLLGQLDQLAAEHIVTNRLAVLAFALTLGMYLLVSLRLFCVAQALRLDLPWHLVAMGACVTQLTVVFSFTPGSLGFLEGGWAAVLGLAGISPTQILVFVIGRRAIVLILTAVAALVTFVWTGESPARLFRAVVTASPGTPVRR